MKVEKRTKCIAKGRLSEFDEMAKCGVEMIESETLLKGDAAYKELVYLVERLIGEYTSMEKTKDRHLRYHEESSLQEIATGRFMASYCKTKCQSEVGQKFSDYIDRRVDRTIESYISQSEEIAKEDPPEYRFDDVLKFKPQYQDVHAIGEILMSIDPKDPQKVLVDLHKELELDQTSKPMGDAFEVILKKASLPEGDQEKFYELFQPYAQLCQIVGQFERSVFKGIDYTPRR